MTKATVIRARGMVTLAGEGPARGEQLFAPLRRLDDAALVLVNGRVEEATGWKRCSPPPGAEVRDLGEVCLAPGVINAHCHLQLSHLAGRTRWGGGFSVWLESLIPLLREPLSAGAVAGACEDMAARGFVFPVVKLNVKYVAPARFDERVRAVAELLPCENCLDVRYRLVSLEDGKLFCKATTRQMAVRLSTGESLLQLPEPLLTLMREFEARGFLSSE